MKNAINHNKGFTLIELLVVIAIVALLSSIAMVAMNAARQDSRNTKREADTKQVQAALELYYDEYNQYPAAEDDTDLLLGYRWDSSCNGGDRSDDWITNLSPTFMVNTPDDPVSSRAETDCYLYEKTSTGYSIVFRLEGETGYDNCNDITLTGPMMTNGYVCLSGTAE